ncbi:MAG: hypothetical protein Q8P84_04430, partial [Deltaproteobacteria bacterium]|nr:hypothetical protein [Deltaproteobacteria bacterium]
DLVLQNIAAAVFKNPLLTKSRRDLLVCYRHLSHCVPCLVSNRFFARNVLVRATRMALADPALDIDYRLETIENFLAEASRMFEEPVTLKDAWHTAYHSAWTEANEGAILKLEEIARVKKWDKSADYRKTCQIYRQAAMKNAVSRLHEEPFSAENLCKLVFMLQKDPFSQFASELFGVFVANAVVNWVSIDAFTHFLLMLWAGEKHYQISRDTAERYQNVVNIKLREQLQRQLPELMAVSLSAVMAMKVSLAHADNLLQAAGRQRVFLEMARTIANEQIQKMVRKTLNDGDDEKETVTHLANRWKVFEESFLQLAGYSPIHQVMPTVKEIVSQKADDIFFATETRKIGTALHRLYARVALFTEDRQAAEIISEKVFAILRGKLFDGKDNSLRNAFIKEFYEGRDALSFLIVNGPLKYPWLNPGAVLKHPSLYTGLSYLEGSYLLAVVLNAEDRFLALIRRTLVVEIGCDAGFRGEAILRNLSATEHTPLKEVIREIAEELSIVLP